jgi:hypothetical protein
MDPIETFEDFLKLELATGQIGGGRQPVEIIDIEPGCLICAVESVVCVTPRGASVTRTAVFKMIHRQTTVEPIIAGPWP